MKFKKIIITNFRQFKGRNELNFSTDDDKNITIVYGGITHGKTTLLQAFNWVFYNIVKLENPNDLLNKEIADNLGRGESAEVEVEIHEQVETVDLVGNIVTVYPIAITNYTLISHKNL